MTDKSSIDMEEFETTTAPHRSMHCNGGSIAHELRDIIAGSTPGEASFAPPPPFSKRLNFSAMLRREAVSVMGSDRGGLGGGGGAILGVVVTSMVASVRQV